MKKYLITIISIVTLICVLVLAGCGNGNGETQNAGGSPAAGSSLETPVAGGSESKEEPAANAEGLADGVYVVDVETDSSMFHINEAKNNQGTLTVKDGKMTLHITLASKNIVNLFLGTAEEAEAASEDQLIQPTTDTVTYSDGMTDDVYGFDIPIDALGEVTVAIIGTHGNWYTHTVTAGNPQLETQE